MKHFKIPKPSPGEDFGSWISSFEPALAAQFDLDRSESECDIFSAGLRAGRLLQLFELHRTQSMHGAENLLACTHAVEEALLLSRRAAIEKKIAGLLTAGKPKTSEGTQPPAVEPDDEWEP